MSLAFEYMTMADALARSAQHLRSILERDGENINARSEDADWLDSLAAVCRERAEMLCEALREDVVVEATPEETND